MDLEGGGGEEEEEGVGGKEGISGPGFESILGKRALRKGLEEGGEARPRDEPDC